MANTFRILFASMLVCFVVCLSVMADDSNDSERNKKSIDEIYEEEYDKNVFKPLLKGASHMLNKRSVGFPKGSGVEVSFLCIGFHWLKKKLLSYSTCFCI